MWELIVYLGRKRALLFSIDDILLSIHPRSLGSKDKSFRVWTIVCLFLYVHACGSCGLVHVCTCTLPRNAVLLHRGRIIVLVAIVSLDRFIHNMRLYSSLCCQSTTVVFLSNRESLSWINACRAISSTRNERIRMIFEPLINRFFFIYWFVLFLFLK